MKAGSTDPLSDNSTSLSLTAQRKPLTVARGERVVLPRRSALWPDSIAEAVPAGARRSQPLTLKLTQLNELVRMGRTGDRGCRPLATCAISGPHAPKHSRGATELVGARERRTSSCAAVGVGKGSKPALVLPDTGARTTIPKHEIRRDARWPNAALMAVVDQTSCGSR